MEYLKIEDIFDLYPELEKEFNWSKQDLVELFEAKLLLGKVEKSLYFIQKQSLEDLISYRNSLNSQKN